MRKSVRLVLATAVSVLAIAALVPQVANAFTSSQGSDTFTGCLVDSGAEAGRLVKLKKGPAPVSSCASNETQLGLSGGDITSLSAGTGLALTGPTGAHGDVGLELDAGFALPQGCATHEVPKAYGWGWYCGADVHDPALFRGVAAGHQQLASAWTWLGDPLELPAGAYELTTNLWVDKNRDNEFDTDWSLTYCELVSGGNVIDHVQSEDRGSPGIASSELTMIGAVESGGPIEVRVRCRDSHTGTGSGSDMLWHDLRINALRLREITTQKL